MSHLSSSDRLAQWRSRFDRFFDIKATGKLTVADFCRQEKVALASFYHWKKKLAISSTRRRQPNSKSASDTRFVPLIVPHVSVSTQLLLPGGAAIELPGELDSRRLTELISAVLTATDGLRRPTENV